MDLLILFNGFIGFVLVSNHNFLSKKHNSAKLRLDWVDLIVIAILFFGCLIYNENIELHFLGLEKHTKASILRRAEEDVMMNTMREIDVELKEED